MPRLINMIMDRKKVSLTAGFFVWRGDTNGHKNTIIQTKSNRLCYSNL